jgi:hypothetical protein
MLRRAVSQYVLVSSPFWNFCVKVALLPLWGDLSDERSEIVTFLVDNLYADAIEAVNSRAALSAYTHCSFLWEILSQRQGFETVPNL